MDRGILTATDRAWLRGDKQYNSEKSELNKRQDIRERVFEALTDFELLADELKDEDRQKIFDRLADESESQGAEEAASVIEFLYRGLNDRTTDPSHIADGPKRDIVERFLAFRTALTSGIAQGKSEYQNPQEAPPDLVTIASNAYLFEFPDDDAVRSELDTDQWRNINRQSPGDIANHDDVAFFLQAMAQYQIHERISARHQAANKAIKDYEDFEETPEHHSSE